MQRAAAVPYYTSGAAAGLALGYLYAWLQVVQLIPGLGWVADTIRSLLPKAQAVQQEYSSAPGSTRHHGSSCPASAAVLQAAAEPLDAARLQEVELSSGSFAVMDAEALGSVLFEMQRSSTARASISSDLLPATPHPSFQSRSMPGVSRLQGISAFDNTSAAADEYADTAASPAAAAAAAANAAPAAGGMPFSQEQLLSSVRARLASFPLDNMSPTTTATALSMYSNLPPAGNSEYGGDDTAPGFELAVGPAEPVEGELDITITNSTGSNLLPPGTPTAAAAAEFSGGSSSSTAALPQPLDTVIPLLALPGSRRPLSGPTVSFAPNVPRSPLPSGVSTEQQQSATLVDSHKGRSGTVLLTDSAVQEHNRHTNTSGAAAANFAANNSYNIAGLGSPRTAYTVGLPAQRVVITKLSQSGSTPSSTCSSPRRQYEQQRYQGLPSAAAAGSVSPVKLAAARFNEAAAAAAAAAGVGNGAGGRASPGALQPPRLPSAHAAVAVPTAAYSAATQSNSSSTHVTAAAAGVSKAPASSSSSSSGGGDDRRAVADAVHAHSKAPKTVPGAQHGVRTVDLQPSSPSTTSAAPAAGGAAGSPRSMQSMSSIRTTDSTGTVERKKQKGLLSMLKSKAMKGRQQVR